MASERLWSCGAGKLLVGMEAPTTPTAPTGALNGSAVEKPIGDVTPVEAAKPAEAVAEPVGAKAEPPVAPVKPVNPLRLARPLEKTPQGLSKTAIPPTRPMPMPTISPLCPPGSNAAKNGIKGPVAPAKNGNGTGPEHIKPVVPISQPLKATTAPTPPAEKKEEAQHADSPKEEKPPVTESSVDKSALEKPSDQKPELETAKAEKPAPEIPAVQKPSPAMPPVEKPTLEKPAPVLEKPVEKPLDDKPAPAKPAPEKPAPEKPAPEKTAPEKPTTEKPSDAKPSPEKSSSENNSSEKPAPLVPVPEKPEDAPSKPVEKLVSAPVAPVVPPPKEPTPPTTTPVQEPAAKKDDEKKEDVNVAVKDDAKEEEEEEVPPPASLPENQKPPIKPVVAKPKSPQKGPEGPKVSVLFSRNSQNPTSDLLDSRCPWRRRLRVRRRGKPVRKLLRCLMMRKGGSLKPFKVIKAETTTLSKNNLHAQVE